MLVRWNERATPACAMRGAEVPVTGRPSSVIVPEVGGSSPESRLTSVDLPAPLGPITACSSPRLSAIETSRTAASPPNDLRQQLGLQNRGRVVFHVPARSLREAAAPRRADEARPADAGEAAGERQHDGEDDDALEQQFALGERLYAQAQIGEADRTEEARERFVVAHELRQLAEAGEGERADDRAMQRLEAAEQDHQQRLGRAVPADDLGVHEGAVHRPHVAGDAGECASEHESRELVAVGVEAERAHPMLVDADAFQHAAEQRAQQEDEEQVHRDELDERHIVERERPLAARERAAQRRAAKASGGRDKRHRCRRRAWCRGRRKRSSGRRRASPSGRKSHACAATARRRRGRRAPALSTATGSVMAIERPASAGVMR